MMGGGGVPWLGLPRPNVMAVAFGGAFSRAMQLLSFQPDPTTIVPIVSVVGERFLVESERTTLMAWMSQLEQESEQPLWRARMRIVVAANC